MTFHTVHPGAVATDITLNADYQGPNSTHFHDTLQSRGVSPTRAAEIILRGIAKGTGRIFIADGHAQDALARLFPTGSARFIKFFKKAEGVVTR